MTQEQKRIKIAEACGWFECGTGSSWSWRHSSFTDEKQDVLTENLPDYFNDLNAIHEALSILQEKDTEFGKHLADVLGLKHKHDFGVWKHASIAFIAKATATQLAEAFGFTLELWEKEL